MTYPAPDWSAQQLAEFLAVVSASCDEHSAIARAVERAAEAVEAEIGAVVQDGSVVFSIGFGAGTEAEHHVFRLAASNGMPCDVPGVGRCAVLVVRLEEDDDAQFVLARAGEPFSHEEANLVRGMGRVLSMTLRILRIVTAERLLRQESQRQGAELQERQLLMEHLFEIQQLISSRAPQPVVFDAIVKTASALFGDEVIALRLIDEHDAERLTLVASVGIRSEALKAARQVPIGAGVAGRSMIEGRLVVAHDYPNFGASLPAFVGDVADAISTAMGTPVSRDGVVAGSLVVASRRSDRKYGQREQDMLRGLGEHVSLALNDASARRAIERALGDAVHEATHDSLTGLPNRALVLDRLEHALARASRTGSHIAALFVDLDRFKVVNDSLGHGVGDDVLVEVARRLTDGARTADTVGRLAGDEFVVIAEDVELDTALALADRLAELIAAPMNLYGRETILSASIGIAHADGSGQADEILRDADVAMYRAKERGRSRIELFDNAMRQRMLERIETEHALRQAIRNGDLRVHYQPIFSQPTGRATGVEALVRWQHADGRLVPPDQFIGVAEEAGLIIPLGAWVLGQACSDVASWQRDHPALAHLRVAVNLSGRQFADAGLADVVANALRHSGLPDDCLTLEITESVLMEEAEATVATLRSLKALGVHLAVDDFGTGYSSLSYLRRFPVDILKIDRSFVSGLGGGDEDSAIVRAIITLAKALDLSVVAEGVETEEQLRELRRFGCHAAQGYLLGRPKSASDALAALLAAESPPRRSQRSVKTAATLG